MTDEPAATPASGRRPPGLAVLAALNLLLLSIASSTAWNRWHQGPPAGMARIAAGAFPSALLHTTVDLPEFHLDVHEVSNTAYTAFIAASGYRPQGTWNLYAQRNGPSAPVVGITFADANAYAEWCGKRLPEAIEWEKACGGAEGRKYPWGNEWKAGMANVQTPAVRPVGSTPGDLSPYGVLDMAGNAFEWTATPTTESPEHRAVMGGCWLFSPRAAGEAIGIKADTASHVTGFRCAWPQRRTR